MKVYEKYRDSGVAWLGEVPAHWETLKMKYVFEERVQKGFSSEPLLSATQLYGVIPQSMYENRTVVATKGLETLKLVMDGDFIISLRSFQGGIEYAYYRGIISPAYTVLKPKRVNKHYFRYLGKSDIYIQLLKSCVTGIREGQNIDYKILKENLLPIPPLSEQTAIATFLDSKCEQLDKAIAQKERVITLLNERRQIIIQRAVTRGLNPDIPLRDSGIDWIGEIPEHWEVKRLKTLFSFGKGLPITKENLVESGIPVINYGQVHSKLNTRTGVNDNIIKYVNKGYLKTNKSSLVKKNDFVFADTSEDINGAGNCAFIDVDGEIFAGYHSIILRSRVSESTRYLAYLFLTDCWRIQIRSKVTGIKVYSITKAILNQSTLIIPPTIEQTQIANYLDSINEKIDRAITLKKEEILRLKEYKQVLINSAVTGKIKIE